MRIVDLFAEDSGQSELITRFESRDAFSRRLGHGRGDAHVYAIEFGPNGQIGRHPTGFSQLFVALRGSGWVSGSDDVPRPLQAGQVARFERGELHAKGAGAEGMLALMVQLTPQDVPEAELVVRPGALTEVQLARARELRLQLASGATKVSESVDGFVYELGNVGTARVASEWIELERERCPFLSFELQWAAAGSLTLRLSGPSGIKQFLAAELPELGR